MVGNIKSLNTFKIKYRIAELLKLIQFEMVEDLVTRKSVIDVTSC